MLPYKSSSLVHPLLSLTHWIFRSLMLPYKSSSHSANHVRCASTGKRVTRFSGRFAPLRIVFPCHRGIGRATKGKRLYGQARRLTSPDLHILCRMCTVDNKTLKSGPRIKFPCHRKGTQGRYGIYLPVSSGKWRISFLGAASFTWAAYVRVFVLSFL